MSEDVVLQRGKGMLHRRSSQSHHFRGRSLLHALERVFVQMTRDETLPAVRTAHLQGTGTADFRFRCIVHSTIFAGELFACQCLVRWTAEGVRLLVVVELVAVEQRAISLVVDRARHRDVRHDALRFTSLGLLTIGVTASATTCSDSGCPNASRAASAIGSRRLLSPAVSVILCATISACSASTAVCTALGSITTLSCSSAASNCSR